MRSSACSSGGNRFESSEQIRQEIERFESVHPCIYAVYDLIGHIPDPLIAEQIRDHVICIEDSFVNSQEWTLSRAVPDLKLGVVGHLSSGKTALVHRYLTGSYMQEESPEGGRFKKEVVIDGQSYLLLIRDEGGEPEQQFSEWVDAVILVFSLESDISLSTVYNHYSKMSHYRNIADVPLILVGTQDAINENSPRVIDDSRARKLAQDLKRCSYYETCATYGLNVEKVFRDACQKIIQARNGAVQRRNSQQRTPTPTTPAHMTTSRAVVGDQMRQSSAAINSKQQQPTTASPHHLHQQRSVSAVHIQAGSSVGTSGTVFSPQLEHQYGPSSSYNHHHTASTPNSARYYGQTGHGSPHQFVVPIVPPHTSVTARKLSSHSFPNNGRPPQEMLAIEHSRIPSTSALPTTDNRRQTTPPQVEPQKSNRNCNGSVTTTSVTSTTNETFDSHIPSMPTPSSTPNAQRKNRRISNLFPLKTKDKDKDESKTNTVAEHVIGCGRPIPTKQGSLYKRSSKALNKEWKKKYVALYPNGKLIYHSSLKDYMENNQSKELFLGLATVKLPNQHRPRQQRALTQPITVPLSLTNENGSARLRSDPTKTVTDNDLQGGWTNNNNSPAVLLTAMEFLEERKDTVDGVAPSASGSDPDSLQISKSGGGEPTPNTKKKRPHGHRRFGSGAKVTDIDDGEDCEFVIVTCDQKQWHFEAANVEERDSWVTAIEEQISRSLQGQMSSREMDPYVRHSHAPRADVLALRTDVLGNTACADCTEPNPDWASLNLGALICIECSGIHRNLGSHISRVRSLDLDDWPVVLISIMKSIGNQVVNDYWEHNLNDKKKPNPESSREEKEEFIRAKYEAGAFRRQLSPSGGVVDAVIAKDLLALWRLLPICHEQQLNATLNWRDQRTPLHLACSVGSPEITQMLLWYGADVKAVDQEGRSALWYAKQAGGSSECEQILLNAGLAPDFGIPEGVTVATLDRFRRTGSTTNAAEGRPSLLPIAVNFSQTPPAKMTAAANGAAGDAAPRRQSTSSVDNRSFERLPASVI